MKRAEPVVVVGAGPAGLATAWELRRRRVPFRLLDAAERVAEPWRGRHEELVLNTHRVASALPGMRFPRGTHAYPTRDEVVAYLERYAARLGAPIEWGTHLERVERDGDDLVLESSRGAIRARHVVLATGPDRVPWLPDWPGAGTWGSRLRHASAFRRAADHEGEDVLVVGLGISGVDLCTTLRRRSAGRLRISVRAGTTLVPRRVHGVPMQPLGLLLRFQSPAATDRSILRTSHRVLGTPEEIGLPTPECGPYARFLRDGAGPPTDDGFAQAVRSGEIGVVPEIVAFEREGVRFADGSLLRPDRVFAATGYRAGLEGWIGHLGVLDGTGRPRAVGRSLPECPGLWFAGLRSAFHGNLHERRVEARRIARGIRRALASEPSTARARSRQLEATPPSMERTEPWTKRASSEAR